QGGIKPRLVVGHDAIYGKTSLTRPAAKERDEDIAPVWVRDSLDALQAIDEVDRDVGPRLPLMPELLPSELRRLDELSVIVIHVSVLDDFRRSSRGAAAIGWRTPRWPARRAERGGSVQAVLRRLVGLEGGGLGSRQCS